MQLGALDSLSCSWYALPSASSWICGERCDVSMLICVILTAWYFLNVIFFFWRPFASLLGEL